MPFITYAILPPPDTSGLSALRVRSTHWHHPERRTSHPRLGADEHHGPSRLARRTRSRRIIHILRASSTPHPSWTTTYVRPNNFEVQVLIDIEIYLRHYLASHTSPSSPFPPPSPSPVASNPVRFLQLHHLQHLRREVSGKPALRNLMSSPPLRPKPISLCLTRVIHSVNALRRHSKPSNLLLDTSYDLKVHLVSLSLASTAVSLCLITARLLQLTSPYHYIVAVVDHNNADRTGSRRSTASTESPRIRVLSGVQKAHSLDTLSLLVRIPICALFPAAALAQVAKRRRP